MAEVPDFPGEFAFPRRRRANAAANLPRPVVFSGQSSVLRGHLTVIFEPVACELYLWWSLGWYKCIMYRTQAEDSRADDSKSSSENLEFPAVARDTDGITIGQLARDAGITLRALRFYQSKGLLSPLRAGTTRIFSPEDRARVALIQQGKRLGFTLGEIRELLLVRKRQSSGDRANRLPMSRKKCVEQIKHLENQRRGLELALLELRQIYTGMSMTLESALPSTIKVA